MPSGEGQTFQHAVPARPIDKDNVARNIILPLEPVHILAGKNPTPADGKVLDRAEDLARAFIGALHIDVIVRLLVAALERGIIEYLLVLGDDLGSISIVSGFGSVNAKDRSSHKGIAGDIDRLVAKNGKEKADVVISGGKIDRPVIRELLAIFQRFKIVAGLDGQHGRVGRIGRRVLRRVAKSKEGSDPVAIDNDDQIMRIGQRERETSAVVG